MDVNTYSTGGGVGGQNGGGNTGRPAQSDTLDERTAYLYTHFRLGTLTSSYEYDATGSLRSPDAGELQWAIWVIENEKDRETLDEPAHAQALAWVEEAELAISENDWSGIGDVRILNVWGDQARTQYKQDQLMMIPAPGAALLAVIGLALVGRFRRLA